MYKWPTERKSTRKKSSVEAGERRKNKIYAVEARLGIQDESSVCFCERRLDGTVVICSSAPRSDFFVLRSAVVPAALT